MTAYEIRWSLSAINAGNFDAPPSLFFAWSGAALLALFGAVAAVLYLLAPRAAALHPALPVTLWVALGTEEDSARAERAPAAPP